MYIIDVNNKNEDNTMKIENFANNFEGICTITFGTNGNGICWVSDTDTETVENLLDTEFDSEKNFVEWCESEGVNPREWLGNQNWGAADEGEIDDDTIAKLTIAVKSNENNEKFALLY